MFLKACSNMGWRDYNRNTYERGKQRRGEFRDFFNAHGRRGKAGAARQKGRFGKRPLQVRETKSCFAASQRRRLGKDGRGEMG